MKRFLMTFLLGMALIPLYSTASDKDAALKEECFKMHKHLMAKPALMTVERCWEVHSYKMKTS